MIAAGKLRALASLAELVAYYAGVAEHARDCWPCQPAAITYSDGQRRASAVDAASPVTHEEIAHEYHR